MGQRQRVLITGASGFVGACLARDRLAAGDDVHLLLRGPGSWRLADLDGQYTAHLADVRDGPGLAAAVRSARPEVVYHLAGHGTLPWQKDRLEILSANLLGTANLLDALDGHDYEALIQVGSSSEYGHKDGPMRADDRPVPRTAYGVSKAAATLLCQAEALRGRPVVSVRIFSAYGQWEDPMRIASYVMGCYLRGETPRVTSGRQPRDFIYADDVVALLTAAAKRPQCQAQILHAGTGVRQTVRDLVEAVAAVCGCGVRPEYGAEPSRQDEPDTWVADIAQTVELTGWRPRHDLRSGVERLWEWYRRRPGGSGESLPALVA
jgi:nucleoside-diphosphate-sugar epimerase